MDKIYLHGMQFYGYHGVLSEETMMGQRFIVDVTLGLSLREAGQSDRLDATVNYAEVYDIVKQIVEGSPVQLIETVAERVAEHILRQFHRVATVRVRVTKPSAPIPGVFQDVAVEIKRYQKSLSEE